MPARGCGTSCHKDLPDVSLDREIAGEHTLRNVGIDNLLLGSDFPQLLLQKTLDAFNRLGLTEEEQRKIRWDNAERLLLKERPKSVR